MSTALVYRRPTGWIISVKSQLKSSTGCIMTGGKMQLSDVSSLHEYCDRLWKRIKIAKQLHKIHTVPMATICCLVQRRHG